MFQATRAPTTALITYLIALPVTVLLGACVPFGFLAAQRGQLALPLGLLLTLALVSTGVYVKARPVGVPELALLPLQLGTVLVAAFSGQDLLTLAGTAALAGTLALTLRLRFALPLALVAAQIAAGILITTLQGSTTPALVATTLTPTLTLLAPRRQRKGVRETLRPAAFLLTALTTLLLLLYLL
ncbi:hypothetical protein [Deinococcus sp. S9]|uniref:hypothetical protein n=1 Tax=Deinococcus sp. S9 TaxID=2545754 RepID=UPI00105598F6|nr:hypothetical protein [Deinococcus sp. S9]TDE85058.1 hypothetical protein E0686_13935 [Deinococcus sp. S9]